MIYVASPYSHKDKRIEHHRFEMAEGFCAKLLAQRHIVFSPIVYAHAMSRKFSLPTDAEFWKFFNNSIMRRCETMLVMKLLGWEASRGVQHEISVATELNIHITYCAFIGEELPEGCVL